MEPLYFDSPVGTECKAVAVREVSGIILGLDGHKKTFAVVGNLLTKSVSVGLSKGSVYTLLNTRYKAKNDVTTFLTNSIHFGSES